MEKLLKIIKSKPDCYLLQSKRNGVYKVMDIESETICMTYDLHHAEQIFDGYDLAKVRKEKEKVFQKWIKEVAE